jgi:hypothetical protein
MGPQRLQDQLGLPHQPDRPYHRDPPARLDLCRLLALPRRYHLSALRHPRHLSDPLNRSHLSDRVAAPAWAVSNCEFVRWDTPPCFAHGSPNAHLESAHHRALQSPAQCRCC